MMSQPDTTDIAASTPAQKPLGKFWKVALLALIVVGAIVGTVSAYRNWCQKRTKDFVNRCRSLRVAQDWNELDALSTSWQKWDSTSAEAVLFRAEAVQGQGKFVEAANLLGQVPVSSPKRLPALIEQTSLLFGAANHPLEGVRVCDQILKLEPRAFVPHQRLIFFYALTLQHELLLRQIQTSMELQCEPIESFVYLMLADDLTFSNGFELNNRWLSRDPTQELFLVARTIHRWNHLAQEASPSNDIKEQMALAEKLLSEYRERYPRNMSVRVFFLDRALIRGDIAATEQLLGEFPSDLQGDSRFWRYRGWLAASQDDLTTAEAAYRESIRRFPLGWIARHELADVMRRRQKFDEVKQLQELALQGKDIRQDILKIPDARTLTPDLLKRIGIYANACADQRVTLTAQRRTKFGK